MLSSYTPLRILSLCCALLWVGFIAKADLPIEDVAYKQQTHKTYTSTEGLPSEAITRLAFDGDGDLYALTDSGYLYTLQDNTWAQTDHSEKTKTLFNEHNLSRQNLPSDMEHDQIRDVDQYDKEIALATGDGLYVSQGRKWNLALPENGGVRWAPRDIQAVHFDSKGQLWFAAPQGVGCRITDKDWLLYTGRDGLPYNDFTCMGSGPSGIWFGTSNGAIQFNNGQWHYRQGRRWLLDNHVNDIVIDSKGNAWIATNQGISTIHHRDMTLKTKAAYFEDEIEKYHRRTTFGYVNPATLTTPGDKSTAKVRYSDNDGFNTGLYLGAMSFAYAATGGEQYGKHAHNAFRALAFLSEVTQGGPYGGPEGLIARNVVPITEEDPGKIYDENYDVRRNQRDTLWKIMERRVPIDKTGEWYWKTDASSDELDGHFFGMAIYFDRVCNTEDEKNEVRVVIRRIIDHLIKHNYNLVDYDGKPTRWGRFSPGGSQPGSGLARGTGTQQLQYPYLPGHSRSHPGGSQISRGIPAACL